MMEEPLAALARAAIEQKILPGCVLGLVDGKHRHVNAFGMPTYASQAPVSRTSIYDVASLTKTIATATLMHLLMDAGQCDLGDPVCAYIPEFAANGKDAVRIEHLMSYTLQLASPYIDDWKGDTSLWTFPELLQLFYAAPLNTATG